MCHLNPCVIILLEKIKFCGTIFIYGNDLEAKTGL